MKKKDLLEKGKKNKLKNEEKGSFKEKREKTR